MGRTHYAKCPNCGADVHVSTWHARGDIQVEGECGKCGRKIYTTIFWEVED